MATAEEITTLREFIAEPTDVGGWTEARLTNILNRFTAVDGSVDVEAAAGYVWSVKASEMSGLVDVTENGSSRKLSDLYKNAMSQASHYRSLSESNIVIVSGRPRTRAITRP